MSIVREFDARFEAVLGPGRGSDRVDGPELWTRSESELLQTRCILRYFESNVWQCTVSEVFNELGAAVTQKLTESLLLSEGDLAAFIPDESRDLRFQMKDADALRAQAQHMVADGKLTPSSVFEPRP